MFYYEALYEELNAISTTVLVNMVGIAIDLFLCTLCLDSSFQL